MADYLLCLNRADKVAKNNLLYALVVTYDGVNFKNGFAPGTLYYADPDEKTMLHPDGIRRAILIDEFVLWAADVNATVATWLLTKQSFDALKALGFFPSPY